MPLTFTKPEVLSLKTHAEFSEKWVQARVAEDPTLLGLGQVDLIGKEKVQSKAGRLDLLLHDDQLNRRYEVELMLGATDPSHIIRAIEYYDIERRRYPAYDHVAVLVAEDITSRFLNVMALLSGSIPLIAIQLKALRVDDKVVLHFTRVLDQTELRSDDEYELGSGGSQASQVDRAWWEQRVSPGVIGLVDQLLLRVDQAAGGPHLLEYGKNRINVVGASGDRRVWLLPVKKHLHLGAYVDKAEEWVQRFGDAGLMASLRRGNKAARVQLAPETYAAQGHLIDDFLTAAHAESDGE